MGDYCRGGADSDDDVNFTYDSAMHALPSLTGFLVAGM